MTTINEIEDFLNNMYKKNYKSRLEKSICPLNNKEFIIDKCKLNFLSEIFSFAFDKVELKKSLIHGLGVFAKQNINKDEIITFYPGDFVEYTPNEDSHLPNHLTILYRSQRFENKFGEVSDLKYRDNDYAFEVNSFYGIIGCNHFTDDPNYLGHFINDGAKTNSTEKSNEIYLQISNLKRNCKFRIIKDLHVAIVATKNINIGEELFIRYGLNYWHSFNNK
jgi:SET domain-containing protein